MASGSRPDHVVAGRAGQHRAAAGILGVDLGFGGWRPRLATGLEVATRVFASADTEPSMRAIAREAGVGIATLYRHFPTRESLVDAVYRDQVARLTDGARELLAQLPPPAALRRWMELFGDWIATKNGMLGTLLAMIESGEIAQARTQAELLAAISEILHAGRATGELRANVTAEDIAASLIGIITVARPNMTPGQSAC